MQIHLAYGSGKDNKVRNQENYSDMLEMLRWDRYSFPPDKDPLPSIWPAETPEEAEQSSSSHATQQTIYSRAPLKGRLIRIHNSLASA